MDWKWLELDPVKPSWPVLGDGRVRVLLIAINVPGYYSLPVRILSLAASQSSSLRERFDTRYVEVETRYELDRFAETVVELNPDIIGFSVNIWNRDACIHVSKRIKAHCAEVRIVVGGQEVTHSVVDYLQEVPELDYILDGEGEIPFCQFLENWDADLRSVKKVSGVSGLHYRHNGETRFTGSAKVVKTLDEVPSPILAGLVPLQQKNQLGVMLEGSRGCPFRCSFCFEGAKTTKVRMASIKRLEEEAEHMASLGASYFHIMDPILCNCDPERLQRLSALFERLRSANPKTIVSVEMYAHKITENISKYLTPFTIIDIGLQTINPVTAKAIHRPLDVGKFRQGIELLKRTKTTYNIYLICGLPYETLASYLKGMKFVLDERPTRIFLNELCLLNGTELRWRAEELGYKFDSSPPYQVRETAWMSQRELKMAQVISKVIERGHNLSSRAVYSLAPWLPDEISQKNRTLSLPFESMCGEGCSGCALTRAARPGEWRNADDVLNDAADMDVELIGGDGVPAGQLLRLAGQLQLAGAARIKFVAPPKVLCNADLIEKLVRRGVWHFKTFVQAQTTQGAGTEIGLSRTLDDLEALDRSFALPGFTVIRPYLEVVVLARQTTPEVYYETIKMVMERNITVTTVPESVQRMGSEWLERLARAYEEGISSNHWLKLPEGIIRRLLESVDDCDGILEALSALDMVSHQPACPPCFQDVGQSK